ncbi:hypothetical protein GE061_016772 [Apolygus lucorum]|uniref:Nonstructural protein WIV domain-containing protein n=1 Tax=Apolygus lucorum TaxID=248454 RepID=A0A8S9XJ83_APOLU|nr:hypothetical protein GE061_016772 [Apolygus lucorum]
MFIDVVINTEESHSKESGAVVSDKFFPEYYESSLANETPSYPACLESNPTREESVFVEEAIPLSQNHFEASDMPVFANEQLEFAPQGLGMGQPTCSRAAEPHCSLDDSNVMTLTGSHKLPTQKAIQTRSAIPLRSTMQFTALINPLMKNQSLKKQRTPITTGTRRGRGRRALIVPGRPVIADNLLDRVAPTHTQDVGLNLLNDRDEPQQKEIRKKKKKKKPLVVSSDGDSPSNSSVTGSEEETDHPGTSSSTQPTNKNFQIGDFVLTQFNAQVRLAQTVQAEVSNSSIYLFDQIGYFNNASQIVIADVRVVLKDDDYAVLSVAAQGAFLTANTYCQFTTDPSLAQVRLAQTVQAEVSNSSIYLFDQIGYFNNASQIVIADVRVVLKDDDYAVLSVAAQGAFLTANTYCQFTTDPSLAQVRLAQTVQAEVSNSSIYLFDQIGYFNNASQIVIADVRVVLKDDDYAVLSVAAQGAFLTANTYCQSMRDGYAAEAVGYVQLQRSGGLCTAKARVTPEHRIQATGYQVVATIKESPRGNEILSCQCLDCAASQEGDSTALLWFHLTGVWATPVCAKVAARDAQRNRLQIMIQASPPRVNVSQAALNHFFTLVVQAAASAPTTTEQLRVYWLNFPALDNPSGQYMAVAQQFGHALNWDAIVNLTAQQQNAITALRAAETPHPPTLAFGDITPRDNFGTIWVGLSLRDKLIILGIMANHYRADIQAALVWSVAGSIIALCKSGAVRRNSNLAHPAVPFAEKEEYPSSF